jgi:hypothetical protein
LLPALWSPELSSGYGIIIGSIILVTVDAVHCKAGFWAAVAAWVIGCRNASVHLHPHVDSPIHRQRKTHRWHDGD